MNPGAAGDSQSGLERLQYPRGFGAAHAQTILHDLERGDLARAFAGARDVLEKACVALLLQELAHFGFLEVLRHRHRKTHDEARIAGKLGAPPHVRVHALRRITAHGLAAMPAE